MSCRLTRTDAVPSGQLAFAREGADLAIFVPFRGCRRPRDKPARHRGRPESHLAAGDIGEDSVAEGVAAAIDTFGSIDILVNNATFQRTSEIFDEIPNDEFE